MPAYNAVCVFEHHYSGQGISSFKTFQRKKGKERRRGWGEIGRGVKGERGVRGERGTLGEKQEIKEKKRNIALTLLRMKTFIVL